jgi:hypothetical protein
MRSLYVKNISKVYIKNLPGSRRQTRLAPCCSSSYSPVMVSVSCAMWCWCVVPCVLVVVIVHRRRCCFPFRTCRLVVNRHLVKETVKYKKNIPIKTHPRLKPLVPCPRLLPCPLLRSLPLVFRGVTWWSNGVCGVPSRTHPRSLA